MAPALLMVCLLARDEVTTLALRALTAARHPLRLLLGQENVPAELRATLVSSGGARESPLFLRGPASLLKVSLQASRPVPLPEHYCPLLACTREVDPEGGMTYHGH